ncbi:EAL domain-containing protein [Modestobacter sp. VKM Ac-2979]|uniref:EAL domain-containing protein n=1 Tax=unclassified Modestobacter TaxID=2643866 RepID=UPI0022AB8E68|nr:MULTISPECIES: EAL domain-containing protein [unclassified Modestobacter]MCZ2810865.1 EAL domain-containing protein [Modestobacter sp. VKM Ac-2979]MCZ2840378.1 EAL domain-containing protein [Modestobacter sp. VKM Ac-2980]
MGDDVAQYEEQSTTDIRAVIADRAVRSVFQPIVELDSGRVVAYEALARGPEGPFEAPDALFAAARDAGCLTELDQACRAAALRGAVAQGLLAPSTVFVNVEPEVLDDAPVEALFDPELPVPGDLRVVLEITERALAARPAELLRTVERVREFGWAIALDDVGAESLSLAFMPLLRPDVVKLDLRLVQERPGPAIAEIMNAVNAYAESTGAFVLAEGIENGTHLTMARALGATLGQGWLFGRPGPGAASGARPGTLRLPAVQPVDPRGELVSPFACLPARVPVREAPKALLIELSKQLERQALRLGETCVVASTFQEARHVTPATRLRYRDLVERVGFVAALGEDLPVEPMPGLRGADLAPGDPVRGEWDVVVLSPHFSAALLARDLGDDGPDMARRFAFALTYERDTVVRAARALLSRVAPNTVRRAATEDGEVSAVPAGVVSLLTGRSAGDPGEALLHRALAAVGTGVTIVDLRLPDQPLVYVNPAFERLAGQPAAELLGRNCRFLQDTDTDPAAVGRIRAAIAAGAECREVLLNRRADGSTWWNECTLTPVTDETGAVVQYIGIQADVTDQVETERALLTERDRVRRYAARIAELDPRVTVPLSLAPPADGPQASTDSPGARRA